MAAEAILGAFMQTLFEKLAGVALDQFRSYKGIQCRLENLSCTLSQLHAFLDDAEAKQLTDASVRGWMAKLKDVAYDIDDLLDNYSAQCMHLKKRQIKLHTKDGTSNAGCRRRTLARTDYPRRRGCRRMRSGDVMLEGGRRRRGGGPRLWWEDGVRRLRRPGRRAALGAPWRAG
ncbi:hypothetical protein BS78_03G310900 [Paspalum vaginatum]|nr:hypothetical protein BS78_03G310900 [Paspalum vaginatum]